MLVERRGAVGEGVAYGTREIGPPAQRARRADERLARPAR